jgi:hypothetical protein
LKTFAFFSALSLAAFAPGAALAYIGPGAGLTAIGTVVAFLGVMVLLVVGFVWYPVKRLMGALRRRGAPGQPETADDPET